MTLGKMYEILSWLTNSGNFSKNNKWIITSTYGGELALCPSSQPDKYTDEYLRKRGFIVSNGDYIYRPR
jgi:hypothetical protein